MSAEKTDDLNKYLTWGNVIKVILFLLTPVVAINGFINKSTVQEYELKTLNTNIAEINTSVKELKVQTENFIKESNSKITQLEKDVDIIKLELKVLKENQTRR